MIRRVIKSDQQLLLTKNIQIHIVYSSGNLFRKGTFLVHADNTIKVHLCIKKTKISYINYENILYTLLLFLEIKSPIYPPMVFMYAIKKAKQTKIEAILDYSCLNCKYLLEELLPDNSSRHIYREK